MINFDPLDEFKDRKNESFYMDDDYDDNYDDEYFQDHPEDDDSDNTYKRIDTKGLSAGDAWLKKYTDQGLDKWPSDDAIGDLLSNYANDSKLTIYRGMNFDTKDAYDKFIADLGDGTLKSGSITSWTTHIGTAKQFSMTKPTYYLNFSLMSAESKKSKEGERIIGYRGVILKVDIDAGVGIDVRKSKYAKEDEIILPPGEFTGVTYTDIKTFKDMASEVDVNAHILNMDFANKDEDSETSFKFFTYLMNNTKKLSEDAIAHIFNSFMPKGTPEVHVKTVDGNYGSKGKPDKRFAYVRIHVIEDDAPKSLYTIFIYEHLFNAAQKKKIKVYCNRMLKAIVDKLEDVDTLSEFKVEGDWTYYSKEVLKRANPQAVNQYKKMIGKKLAPAYNELNGPEANGPSGIIRKINNATGEEREKLMKKYHEDLLIILKNAASLG